MYHNTLPSRESPSNILLHTRDSKYGLNGKAIRKMPLSARGVSVLNTTAAIDVHSE